MTVPLPSPLLLTVRVNIGLNVAVTVLAALMVTVHIEPEEVVQPFQPVNANPEAAAAVRVTVVPLTNVSEQSEPHVIPDGFDVTVPLPASALFTVSAKLFSVKVAVTVLAAVWVTVQVRPATASQPLQLASVELAAGVAVSVTWESLRKEAQQLVPQLMPAGADVTVP